MPRLLKIPADFFAEIYSDNVPYWIRFLLTSPVQEKYLPARHVIIINNRKVDSFSSESCCDQHELLEASGLVDQCCRFLLRRMIIRAASILLDSGGVMEFGSS
ncbi:unnamed protein product [Sphagnum jensenii]|uniref:Uncharacterized protein n=1 Tax=Sphagnum jensenii TaxID=128206 RepID=A0ABP0X8E1_9BRYO